MTTVGIRELKDKLSAYIKRAEAGEEILVTDRGKVVARLAPPTEPGADERARAYADLIRRGVLVPGGKNRPELYPKTHMRKKVPFSVLDLLDEDRGPHESIR